MKRSILFAGMLLTGILVFGSSMQTEAGMRNGQRFSGRNCVMKLEQGSGQRYTDENGDGICDYCALQKCEGRRQACVRVQ